MFSYYSWTDSALTPVITDKDYQFYHHWVILNPAILKILGIVSCLGFQIGVTSIEGNAGLQDFHQKAGQKFWVIANLAYFTR